MLQVYPFHGTDVQEVYAQMNCFLGELAIIEVQVKPEDIRSNTKYYPDWDRTATTIEVCIDFSGSPAPHEIAEQVGEIHQAVVNGQDEPSPETETPSLVDRDPFDPFLPYDDEEDDPTEKTEYERMAGEPFLREV